MPEKECIEFFELVEKYQKRELLKKKLKRLIDNLKERGD